MSESSNLLLHELFNLHSHHDLSMSWSHIATKLSSSYYEQIASYYALAFNPCREEYLVVGMGCARLTLQLRRGFLVWECPVP